MPSFLTLFTLVHVAISLAAIGSGFVVIYDMFRATEARSRTKFFLITTILTSVTGFGFPVDRILPSHIFGVLSLIASGTRGLRPLFSKARRKVAQHLRHHGNLFPVPQRICSDRPKLPEDSPTAHVSSDTIRAGIRGVSRCGARRLRLLGCASGQAIPQIRRDLVGKLRELYDSHDHNLKSFNHG